MKIYRTETQQAYDELMTELEGKGREWMCGEKPTQLDNFRIHGKDTYFYVTCGGISLSDGDYFNKNHKDEPIIEYKSKGDNQMLNTECKQCKKKWYNRKAKYCSTCGKKLVSEPEFKSGDIVATMLFVDGSFGLVLLNEDLTNQLTSVDGLWYIKRDCTVYDGSLGVIKEDTRHATTEEIAEYKSALQFHEHGRDPFELKVGDLIKDGNSNRCVENPYMYIKEMFYKSGYELLATVEEVNEWLEK